MRFASYGARVCAICPAESRLAHTPAIAQRYGFSLTSPLRSLRHAILSSKAEYLLPADDLSVWLLHELAEEYPALRERIERSLGSAARFPVLRSRFQLLSLAHRLGISVPRTDLIAHPDELASWCSVTEQPFVLKKDGTWGGLGVQIVRTASEARAAFGALSKPAPWSERAARWLRNGDGSAFARLRCLGSPEITAQSFVQGVPANSMYACHGGRILGEVQASVVASKGKTGPSLVIQLMDDARISRAGVQLAEALQLSGFFGLDFMLDARTGEPFLLELNPRFTQLGHVAVAGQPDLAGSLWSQWSHRPAPPPGDPSLESAVYFHPDGAQLTRNTASFSNCRPDVLPAEWDALLRLSEAKPTNYSLRRQLWAMLSRLKGTLQTDSTPQAFYYRDLRRHAEETEAMEPARLAPVVSIAS